MFPGTRLLVPKGVSAKASLGSNARGLASPTANQRFGCTGKIPTIGPMYASRGCLPGTDSNGLVQTAYSVEMAYLANLVGYVVSYDVRRKSHPERKARLPP